MRPQCRWAAAGAAAWAWTSKPTPPNASNRKGRPKGRPFLCGPDLGVAARGATNQCVKPNLKAIFNLHWPEQAGKPLHDNRLSDAGARSQLARALQSNPATNRQA